jgi:hypothetical protein
MENAPSPAPRGRIGPALTLMLLAPLIAEVLPGATRVSSIFVLPLEMCIWGGGALLARAAVRHWKLGWLNLLLLGFALSIAEEFLIQQTSLAPMMVQIFKGADYARAGGINYLYLLWALCYEAVLVVVVPVMVTELIYRSRRHDTWVTRTGVVVAIIAFLIACLPAWYLWTQFVRDKILHVGIYNPPAASIVLGAVAFVTLIVLATGPTRRTLAAPSTPLSPPPPWGLFVMGAVAGALWFGLLLLAFRIKPEIPPGLAVAGGIAVAAIGCWLVPRFAAHPAFRDAHRMGIALGAMLGTNAINYLGFINGNAAPLDLYGKMVLDAIGTMLLIWLALSLRAPVSGASSPRAA